MTAKELNDYQLPWLPKATETYKKWIFSSSTLYLHEIHFDWNLVEKRYLKVNCDTKNL